jgi:inner membrane protein
MSLPPSLPSASERFARRNAVALKLLFVGVLALLLLAPLHLVESTLQERRARHEGAVATITQTWGKSQRLMGPVLVVPYAYKTETEEWTTAPDGRRFRDKVTRTHVADALFLPEQLEAVGRLDPSARRLGIYATHVYAAKLRLHGRFAAPTFAFSGVAAPEPQWDRARVCFAITDLRGTPEALALKWGAADVPLQPGARLEGFGAGLHAPVKLAADGGGIDFALELMLNGSGGLALVPIGRQTTVKLASSWLTPGFYGAFLPVQRDVGAGGFNATWQVSYYGRDFPQQWSANAGPAPAAQVVEASAFGVNLVESVTAYRTIERAIKYGILFLALVFVTFFLFEIVSAVRLNALNYLLVGAALCLFYLGLLSLSEFIGFTPAYAGAAGASLLLVGLYGRSVLQSGGRALLVCGMLGGVYGYLYFVLRMEDFSLLAGTAALFALLAAVMYATRRFDGSEGLDTATAVGEVAS